MDKVKSQVMGTIKLRSLIEEEMHIVLGFSAGPDSLCLFHILKELAPQWKLKIYPVHVNHKFRAGAAEEDQAYAEEISRQWGFPCRSMVYYCDEIARREHITSEEAGRKVRYEAFAKVAEEIRERGVPEEKIRIAVAQNADDQAETILFRILRGAGTDGISGINYSRVDQNGNVIIRPLLDVFKSDILDYCKDNGLQPRRDHTNFQPIYARNKIRLELLPYLEKEYNSNVRESLLRLGRIASIDKECLWQQAQQLAEKLVVEKQDKAVYLDLDGVRQLHRAVRQRVFATALKEIGLTEDVAFYHYEKCEELTFAENPSFAIDLPNGYFVTRQYQRIKFAKQVEASAAPRMKIREMSREAFLEWRATLDKDSFAAFDGDALELRFGPTPASKLTLRHRLPGDYIALSEKSSKKMQDYFVDNKIPRDEREKVWIVGAEREILWIIKGVAKNRYSGKYRVNDETKNVITIEIFG